MIQLYIGMNGANSITDLCIRHIQPIKVIPSIESCFLAYQLNPTKLIPVLIGKLCKADRFGISLLQRM